MLLSKLMLLGTLVNSAFAEEPASADPTASTGTAEPTESVAVPPPTEEATRKLRGFVGLTVGPHVAFNPLQAGVHPRLEAGVMIPVGPGSLAPVIAGSWVKSRTQSDFDDERLSEESGEYLTTQQEIEVSVGALWRFDRSRFVPEFGAVYTVNAVHVVANGSSSGAEFGEFTETYAAFGGAVWAGLNVVLGPGEFIGRLEFEVTALQGELTGRHVQSSLTPMLGYRLVF